MVALVHPVPQNRLGRRFCRPKSDLPRSSKIGSGFRYYSPDIARWLSRDPIGEKGGWNLYGFSHNNSINTLDALGQFSQELSDCVRASKFAIELKETGVPKGGGSSTGDIWATLYAKLDAKKCKCICEWPRFVQEVRFSYFRTTPWDPNNMGSYLYVGPWKPEGFGLPYYNSAPYMQFQDVMDDWPGIKKGIGTGRVELFTKVVCTAGSASGTTIRSINWGIEAVSVIDLTTWPPSLWYHKRWWPSGPYPRSF